MNKIKPRIFILFFSAILLYGCFTVSVNFSGANINQDAITFNVTDFINRADEVQPSLAIDMTEALRNKMESQTHLKMTNGYGDINFQGEIYKYTVVSKSITAGREPGGGQAAENRFTIGVRITYSNLLEPEKDFEKTFERFEDFPETIESVRDEKTELIIENLIDDIFKEAFVNW